MKKIYKYFKRYRHLFYSLILGIITFLVFVPIFTYVYFARDLTSKEAIMNRNDTGVLLLDRNNRPFFSFYEARQKKTVSLSEIPVGVQNALIATEDKEFYTHPGFSIKGIMRSIYLDIIARDTSYGGSTITQQLVKNVLLNSRKNFLRKYQEVVLAQEIERKYTKKEILEMYLNSVYFGEGAFGIENASLAYFGKHAKQLNMAEGTLLIGILPAPSAYSPISGSATLAKARQEIVVNNMVLQGYLSSADKTTIENTPLTYLPERDDLNSTAPHFALMVRDALIQKFGEEMISRSGFRVRTTLNVEWQTYAEETVKKNVEALKGNDVSNGAAVVINPKTGEVEALVGSADWYNMEFGKLNIAASAIRQPGSSFKPIVYAAAFERGLITAATELKDDPETHFGKYKPQDYDRKYRGKVLARRALANSLNIPAVDVMSRVGVPNALEMASRLGISTLKDPSNYGLSLVLGTGEVKLLELTSAYATFANKGVSNDITTILEIDDKRGQKIYSATPAPKQTLDPDVAFLISSILSDNKARAEEFGSLLNISRPAAVKTGTTDDYKDALTLGFTPSLAIGVWVGNNDGKPMDRIAGSLGAAPIWRSLMEHFLSGTPLERFTIPASIVKKSICSYNGLISREATSSAQIEYFIPGTEPRKYCNGGDVIGGPSIQVSPEVSNTSAPEPTQVSDVQPTDTITQLSPTETSTIDINITPLIQ